MLPGGERIIARAVLATAEEKDRMPQLIQVSPDAGRYVGRYIGVDNEGRVWRGEMKRRKSGEDYLEWTPIDSEFPGS